MRLQPSAIAEVPTTQNRTDVLTRAPRSIITHKCGKDLCCGVEASGKNSRHTKAQAANFHHASRVELSELAPKIIKSPQS